MFGDSCLNILVPLYENVNLARDCIKSIRDFASCNMNRRIKVWISDDSLVSIVTLVLDNVEFSENVTLTVCPLRAHSSNNHAVDNWNYLLDFVANGEYYVLIHHDERLPPALLPKIEDSILILSLEGVAKRRNLRFSRFLTQLALKTLPEILLFVNFIGPTACVITNVKLEYNNKLRWLVDVDYYLRLFQVPRTIESIELSINSVDNNDSITKAIDQYRSALEETRLIGVKPLLRGLILVKYWLKKLL